MSKRYIKTPIIGRSHGIHAEVTTFGLVVANWLDEIKRSRRRLENSINICNVGKISGAVGTYSNVLPKIEAKACSILKLKPAKISSQIINRDYHADYFSSLAFIASFLLSPVGFSPNLCFIWSSPLFIKSAFSASV